MNGKGQVEGSLWLVLNERWLGFVKSVVVATDDGLYEVVRSRCFELASDDWLVWSEPIV